MPQTPVQFVDGVCAFIMTVHEATFDTHFPSIVGMTDEIARDAGNNRVGVSGSHHLIPFQSFSRGET